jgi:hypothetical protein
VGTAGHRWGKAQQPRKRVAALPYDTSPARRITGG